MSALSKMNGRDRNLLILIVTAIVFYLCYTFVMAPYKTETEMLQGELEAIESELARAEELSGREEELKKQEAKLKEEVIEKYSAFLTDIKQSRILYRVDIMAAGAGLPVTDYMPSADMISQVTVETGFYVPPEYPLKKLAFEINPKLRAEKEDASASGPTSSGGGEAVPQAAVESEDMIPGTDISIGFEAAAYESIYNFIGAVETLNKTAFLRTIDIKENAGGLNGQLTFSFYSLPRLDPGQKDGLDFSPAIPPGKANPFY